MSKIAELEDHASKLDKNYRLQRHIYNLTRKYFLFGRDRLIQAASFQPGDTVLEVGVGTARNLILLARRYPSVKFHGVDASKEMLRTAKSSIEKAGLSRQIELHYGFAEELSAAELLGEGQKFDAVLFSYALSMIDNWQGALNRAVENLAPGGSLHIVDFWDQHSYPRWFRRPLQAWLSTFHVSPRNNLREHLEQMEVAERASISFEPIFSSYAYLAQLRVVSGLS